MFQWWAILLCAKNAFKIENTLSTEADEDWIRATYVFAAACKCVNSSKSSAHQNIVSTSGDASAAFAIHCGNSDFKLFGHWER